MAEAIAVIRLAVQLDGGDIELRDVDEARGIVLVELTGGCAGCPSSTGALEAGIARIVMDRVPTVTAVESWTDQSETILTL